MHPVFIHPTLATQQVPVQTQGNGVTDDAKTTVYEQLAFQQRRGRLYRKETPWTSYALHRNLCCGEKRELAVRFRSLRVGQLSVLNRVVRLTSLPPFLPSPASLLPYSLLLPLPSPVRVSSASGKEPIYMSQQAQAVRTQWKNPWVPILDR